MEVESIGGAVAEHGGDSSVDKTTKGRWTRMVGTIPPVRCTTAVQFLDLGQVATLAARHNPHFLIYTARLHLDLSWIMLVIIGWALGLAFVLVLMRMAGDQDRAARHEQDRIDPYADVTITRAGIH